jgi:hypothetical protein
MCGGEVGPGSERKEPELNPNLAEEIGFWFVICGQAIPERP